MRSRSRARRARTTDGRERPPLQGASEGAADVARSEKAVRELQQALGNQTIQKLFRGGAEIAAHDDPREEEARSISRGEAPAPSNDAAPASAAHPLGSGGVPLSPVMRLPLERRIGRNLGDVRIHRDADAADAAEALGAKAFTVGADVVLARDRYDPSSPESMRLLAHESTHAASHGGAAPSVVFRETAQEIIDRFADLGDQSLGAYLGTLAIAGRYALVTEVISKLGYFSRDDVAMAMIAALSTVRLIHIARSAAGQSMLRAAREEIGSGWVTGSEWEKGLLLEAVLGDEASRPMWNLRRIHAIKQDSPSDLESLARIFEDEQIVDDGTVQSRLQVILTLTEHLVVPGLQTRIAFSDTGFRGDRTPNGPGFRDPHPSSQNQPGHFLTAVGLLTNPGVVSRRIPFFGTIRSMVGAPETMSDADVALRLTIGHEKAPDPPGGFEVAMSVLFTGVAEDWFGHAPEGETEEQRNQRVGQAMVNETQRRIAEIIAAFRAQFQATTDDDVAAWNETLGRLGGTPQADDAAIEGPDSPLNRVAINPALKGNSRQDLRLSLMGYRLGQLIRDGQLHSNADVAAWIRTNLGPLP